jgi:hypothetical protein
VTRTSGKGDARAAARGIERGGWGKKGDDASFQWFLCIGTEGKNGGEGAQVRCAAKREGRGSVRRARVRGVWRSARRAISTGGQRSTQGVSRGGGSLARGPAGEEGKWAGPKENCTLLDLFKYFKKDLNRFDPNVSLPNSKNFK